MPQVFNSETEREKKKGTTFSVLFAKISPLPPLLVLFQRGLKAMAGTVSVVNFFLDPTRAPREESTSRQLPSFCL